MTIIHPEPGTVVHTSTSCRLSSPCRNHSWQNNIESKYPKSWTFCPCNWQRRRHLEPLCNDPEHTVFDVARGSCCYYYIAIIVDHYTITLLHDHTMIILYNYLNYCNNVLSCYCITRRLRKHYNTNYTILQCCNIKITLLEKYFVIIHNLWSYYCISLYYEIVIFLLEFSPPKSNPDRATFSQAQTFRKKSWKVNPERIDICFEICFEQVPRKLDQKS